MDVVRFLVGRGHLQAQLAKKAVQYSKNTACKVPMCHYVYTTCVWNVCPHMYVQPQLNTLLRLKFEELCWLCCKHEFRMLVYVI